MNNKPPVWVFRNLRALVPSQLEQRLSSSRILLKTGKGWSPSAKSRGLFFDLSKIEWVELGALVQVVLLVESAVREGMKVEVALPLGQPRDSERRWLESISSPSVTQAVKRRIEMRLRVRGYLEHLRLLEILKAPHLVQAEGTLTIHTDFDASQAAEERANIRVDSDPNKTTIREKSAANEEWPLNERQYRHVFPLTWFSVEEQPKRV